MALRVTEFGPFRGLVVSVAGLGLIVFFVVFLLVFKPIAESIELWGENWTGVCDVGDMVAAGDVCVLLLEVKFHNILLTLTTSTSLQIKEICFVHR